MLDVNDVDIAEQKRIEDTEAFLREQRQKAIEEDEIKQAQKKIDEPEDISEYLKKHIGYYIFYFAASSIFVYLGGSFLGFRGSIRRYTSTAFELIPSLIVGLVVTGAAIYRDVKHFKWVQKDKEDRGLK